MEQLFNFLIEFTSNPTDVLSALIKEHSHWIYGFLFLLIFAETGLIILAFLMPFLPGDALLFAIGIISAREELNIYVMAPLLTFAALLGDNVNYFVGRRLGRWFLTRNKVLFLKPEHLYKAEKFFETNGKKSIIMARFIPVIRTIVPFLSGATNLKYTTFLLYSSIGAILWVGALTILGYSLGQFEIVKNNVEKVIILIIIFANIPLIRQIFTKNKPKENEK
ncbi:MAG: VTT domain-containing protein [Flavobacteriales bacterium]|nr:VTT domain-containing protein [Flavobacteriales bacterium]